MTSFIGFGYSTGPSGRKTVKSLFNVYSFRSGFSKQKRILLGHVLLEADLNPLLFLEAALKNRSGLGFLEADLFKCSSLTVKIEADFLIRSGFQIQKRITFYLIFQKRIFRSGFQIEADMSSRRPNLKRISNKTQNCTHYRMGQRLVATITNDVELVYWKLWLLLGKLVLVGHSNGQNATDVANFILRSYVAYLRSYVAYPGDVLILEQGMSIFYNIQRE